MSKETLSIRNFCIIAHIDHGKSTLADRMLEITKTIEKRLMREQFLDMHPLERERGITIKMQPVRMQYALGQTPYVLNLIDTPGHIDFNYEVSRALAAVEGAVLLVDATQGVEAQTLSNVELARSLNLKIIPVVNKIDLPQARIAETKAEVMGLLGTREEEILEVSGKTGEGVEKLLEEIIAKIPPPWQQSNPIDKSELNNRIAQDTRALIFDYEYSSHRGVIAHVRVFGGDIKKGSKLRFAAAGEKFTAGEIGIFKPALFPMEILRAGEIGYVVTNTKEAKMVRVGDTILSENSTLNALPGYKEIKPVVFSSIYPEDQDQFEELKKSLERLKLADSSLFFEEESSGILGRGFRCGFLGMLHLEIVVEKLYRDFKVKTIAATPSVKYKIDTKMGEIEVYSPHKFPDGHEIKEIFEPWLRIEILLPPEKLAGVMKLLREHEAEVGNTERFSEARLKIEAKMPLRELMCDFFDELKSVSSGYASLNYEFGDMRRADLLRLDVIVADESVPAFARIVHRHRLETEAEAVVEKLYKILPKALFALKIQASAGGRILASRTIKAASKDVTQHMYGGDRTRKMKLWKKQQRGKKRLSAEADYEIPAYAYLKLMKK
ncbi:elongation factor 4 [Candidatus Giovannonibacteria bacterium RIFCSPHIGHO2_02_43_13]|uniref:Elongation factor 4 n=1 Tax=Candidatus Giovannonibacteria bacterium RIFCSPHIGHO2_02_43_13 TaxID=1798330 RepID=A0A1F5WSV8_9BACT|nr:MAG: elongation factor 4 [Candidatus Giovannonibacteria bacterium RIFCSPHIGHO2_12_FULL_44_42]OGF78714.1 MAG: elongation factor 4 [Candidatus Giovannonibacteria bacterium RIFCSPHIGHO2_02_43_13]OGF88946.1 MAG: elongation factor 4 [Candidatus Giovannonibacteria bacterium RIFCSPLOWO2_02_FULL_43_54]OGF96938.1 MAG: elongation factor 4 [Candidatus Giovannonibacteria bacterium RIFCSPLOWO2_12_FULL_44_32]